MYLIIVHPIYRPSNRRNLKRPAQLHHESENEDEKAMAAFLQLYSLLRGETPEEQADFDAKMKIEQEKIRKEGEAHAREVLAKWIAREAKNN
jgi:hypothetical protein